VAAVIVLGGSFLLNSGWWFPRRSNQPGRAGVGDQHQWKEITYHDGGYRVLIPGDPIQREERTATWPGMDVKVKSWELERRELPALFFTFHFDAPIDRDDVEQVLDLMAKEIARGKKGKLVSAKKVNMEGYPGREAVIEYTNSRGVFIQISRFYFVKSRLLHAAVVTSKEGSAADYVRTFLESFRLIGNESNEGQ
jgi:hypothetical protein